MLQPHHPSHACVLDTSVQPVLHMQYTYNTIHVLQIMFYISKCIWKQENIFVFAYIGRWLKKRHTDIIKIELLCHAIWCWIGDKDNKATSCLPNM